MRSYFGSKISPHLVHTPEKFLICYDVPIARTGVQQYLGSELGLTDRPNDIIDVYRTEDEVFDPKAMASFEGKPFTDEHPTEEVNPTNFVQYGRGAITNVRRGTGNENNMLLADIIVYNKNQIDEIMNKQKREISCGYECEYVPYKDGYKQQNIVGNHVALVTAGRAGSKVAIKDNKANSKRGGKVKMGDENKKFKIPRRRSNDKSVSDYFKAVGMKIVAQDADPEDLMDAVNDLVEEKMADENSYEELKKEEVKGAFDNNTPVTEHPTSDEETCDEDEVKESITEVKDMLNKLINDMQIKEPENGEEVFDEEPDGMESLDALEEELIAGDDGEEFEEEEEIRSVEEPPEEIPMEDGEEEIDLVTDSAIDLIRAIKPIIAIEPDKNKRKKISDNLSKVLKEQISRKNRNSVKDDSNDVYGKLMKNKKTTKDSKLVPEQDIGKLIAAQFNPHYKNKEGK